MTDSQKVTIDGKEYVIQRFRALRAVLVLASVTRIAEDVPELIANATKEYSAKHSITITESMSKLPRWEGFSKEDFDKAEQETGKREIELPSQPNSTEALLSALPKLIESTARREIVRLFAILLIPNEELRDADRSDKIEEALDKYEELVLFDAEIDELVGIAVAAQESVSKMDKGNREKLGKALSRMLRAINPEWAAMLQTDQTSDTKVTTPDSTEPMLMSDAPTSFTDSDSPMDGTETRPSMASLGTN